MALSTVVRLEGNLQNVSPTSEATALGQAL